MTPARSGSELLARGLVAQGTQVVFSVPGTQNVGLLEDVRAAGLRVLSGTSELTTSFMANGHARLSRRPAVLTTIPGPGFTYALTGVAEARLDSVPLVWICLAPPAAADARQVLQAIPQVEMAGPLVKEVVVAEHVGDLAAALARAFRSAGSGNPGPVLLLVTPAALEGSPAHDVPMAPAGAEASLRAPPPSEEALAAAVEDLQGARRPLLYVGQGGLDAPSRVRAMAEALGALVVTTTSARGVLPEDHPLVVPVDRPGSRPDLLNELAAGADRVVALGCGFSHNGSHGFRLHLDPETLIHVDASEGAFQGPYPARRILLCDVRTFVDAVLRAAGPRGRDGPSQASEWRRRIRQDATAGGVEPRVPGVPDGSMATLFAELRAALPRDAVVVTDSGRHQMLARRHFRVLSPGALMVPTNFQSMGFGIPAAIGAAIGAKATHPERRVVALIGDGGLQISMGELLVTIREGLDLPVIVFSDGEFALIAEHQRRDHGRTTATLLQNSDLEAVAHGLGCGYLRVGRDGGFGEVFERMSAGSGVVVVEVPLSRSLASRGRQAKALARESVRRTLGASAASWLARWARRLTGRTG